MESESFERGLRVFTRRAPFVGLTSGGSFTVDHPEALVLRGGLAVYVAPGVTPTLFDRAGVTRLTGAPDTRFTAA